MSRRIRRSIRERIRRFGSLDERWKGKDGGLILCWEKGRERALREPETASRAKAGELPVLGWTGGVDKKLKSKKVKYGTLFYLAHWQGLRGEDLDIDTSIEKTIVCNRTGVAVVFTGDRTKTSEP